LTDACYASAAPEERWGRRSEFDSRRPDIICEKRFGAFCVGAPRIGREGVGKREFPVEEGLGKPRVSQMFEAKRLGAPTRLEACKKQ